MASFHQFFGLSHKSLGLLLLLFAVLGKTHGAGVEADVVLPNSGALDTNQLLTKVQEASFDYFYEYGHPVSGLARDSSARKPDICAIGGSGMGFFNLGVGIERGFIARSEGAARVLKELKFLSEKAERFHGAFPHFINGQTGKVIRYGKYGNGADIVETAFLMQGVLFAREYFSQQNPDEIEIRLLANELWREVDWTWFVGRSNSSPALIWNWSPNYGFQKLQVVGFNECQIVYVLALASPTHPIQPRSYWEGWETADYSTNRTEFGIPLELGNHPRIGPPLFMTQYSYLGMDPHRIMFHGKSYFDHFRDFCLVQVRYAQSRTNKYKGYGPLWGITASVGPDGYRGFAPGLRDNGTIAPTAALSSMPYVPAESISCLVEMYYKQQNSKLWGPYGFYDAFNLSRNWVAKQYLAIDEGPIAPMIENYRSGLCWKTFMKCPEIQPVLKMLNDGEKSRQNTL
ncbi:MAG TPA: glucoamylase family protein [Verrucomicrobiae bacterium]